MHSYACDALGFALFHVAELASKKISKKNKPGSSKMKLHELAIINRGQEDLFSVGRGLMYVYFLDEF